MINESWKSLAIRLALERGHYLGCFFKQCTCGAVEKREEIAADILRKKNEEEEPPKERW